MPIIHIKKHEINFVQLDKRPLNDERLSYKARGLWAYLMSKPPDWKVRERDLINRSEKDGRHSVRSALDELISLGYGERVMIREEGKIKQWDLNIYEQPIEQESENQILEIQESGFQDVENLQVENQTYIKNDNTKNDNTKIEKDSPAQEQGTDGGDLESYFSEKKAQLPKQEKKTRKKSTSIQDLERLRATFARVRGCDLPSFENQKSARAAQVNWNAALRELQSTCYGNVDLAERIIEIDVTEYMRGTKDPRYPMIEPRSFKTRFLARALEMRDKQSANHSELKDWEKMIVANKGKIPDFIRDSIVEETPKTKIGVWILNNPEAKRVPESIYLGE